MPHAFKQSLDDLCCLNLIGSRNATLEAPRSSNRAAQNKIFDDFSCLGLGLEDESDGLFRSAPQSRSVSPPPAFPPPLAVSPPLDPARAAPSSAPGAQDSAFSAALAAATGAAVKSSSAAFADQLPQLPRSAFPPFPANVPAVPLPPSRPSSSSSLPSYPLSRESLLRRPTRIILVRHGQSEGNLDEGIYTRIADSRVSLTPLGFEQAVECGKQIRKLIEFDRRKGGKQGRGGEGGKEGRRNAGGGDSGEGDYNRDEEEDDWGVYFYVSPYLRTLQTLRGIGRAFDRRHILGTLQGIGRAFDRRHILGVREEPRLREQDFGNFQVPACMRQIKDVRQLEHARRHPLHSSPSHLTPLWQTILHHSSPPRTAPHHQVQERMRQIKDMRQRFGRFFYRFPEGESSADVYDRVTGRQFEGLLNPGNCEIRVMEMGEGGKYSLAVRHSEYELFSWGLTPDMIAGEPGSGQFEGLLNPGKCEIRVMEMGEGGKYSLAVRHSEYELFSQFEGLLNPGNCEIRVMEMGEGGKYSLAVRHSEYELFSWGLTPDMIAGPPPSAAAAAMTPAAVPAAATPHAAAGAAAPVCFSA
ncbi:unnamed protein product [Closterium sp. NIES-65]|nr:unnamed protein product [Closterium sp. NIES-65]